MKDDYADGPVNNDLQRLNLSSELSQSRRSSIEDALRNFKQTVLQQNLNALRILVDAAQEEGRALTSANSIDEIAEAYEQLFEEYGVGFSDAETLLLEDSPNSAGSLSAYWLDGVEHKAVGFDARDQWWNSIQNAINEHQHDIRPTP
ncbi:hypothetical protein Slin15195_G036540 [Septoria linicola]|uniref:Uncharacterized protein n=1 Tax=Septoria linicola TaxID=215465 RepID=A0A9Q9APS1_9PEZI|nr:hypothetical protein Slin15195_G036540 [Septoria linicola]